MVSRGFEFVRYIFGVGREDVEGYFRVLGRECQYRRDEE